MDAGPGTAAADGVADGAHRPGNQTGCAGNALFSWTAKDTPDYLTWDYQCRRVPVAGVWFPVMLQREVYAEARVETERRDASQVLREAEQAAC